MQNFLKTLCFVITIISICCASESSNYGINCYQIINNAGYKLDSLASPNDYKMYLGANEYIYFNLCEYAHTKCNLTTELSTFANLFIGDFDGQDGYPFSYECYQLTSDKGFSFQEIDRKDQDAGLIVNFNYGEKLQNDKTKILAQHYQFQLVLKCNLDLTEKLQIIETRKEENDRGIKYIINAESPYSCPIIKYSAVTLFIEERKQYFAIVFFLIGIIECYFGERLFTLTLFLTGMIITFITLLVLFFALFVHSYTSLAMQNLILIIALIIGIFVGSFTSKIEQLGLFVLGGAAGLVLGSLIYMTLIAPFEFIENENFGLIACSILCAIGTGYFAQKIKSHILIWCTTLIGSYLVMRSLSLLIGGFPDENQIAEIYQNRQNYKIIPRYFWFYMIFLVILFISGIIVQYKFKKSQRQKDFDQIIYEDIQIDSIGRQEDEIDADHNYYHKVDEQMIKN